MVWVRLPAVIVNSLLAPDAVPIRMFTPHTPGTSASSEFTAKTLPPPDVTVTVGVTLLTMIPEASVMRNRIALSTTAPAAGGVLGISRIVMWAGADGPTPYQYGMRATLPEMAP